MLHDEVDAGLWFRAVADDVPEAVDGVDAAALDVGEDDAEGVDVAVVVGGRFGADGGSASWVVEGWSGVRVA